VPQISRRLLIYTLVLFLLLLVVLDFGLSFYRTSSLTEGALAHLFCWGFTFVEEHNGAVVAVFTIVLSVATIGLGVATYGLYKAGREQIAVARDTAEAAKSTAEHTRTVERAYLKFSHRPTGLRCARTGECCVEMGIHNRGHTPATVTGVLFEHVITATPHLPVSPSYTAGKEKPRSAFLVAGMQFGFEEKFDVTPKEYSEIRRAKLHLFLLGYVDYIDAFGQRHRAGYARVYNPLSGHPNNLSFIPQPGYNYDRPREEGEGNDW
jgi:hypothetical protein